jgi:hypothetical protein
VAAAPNGDDEFLLARKSERSEDIGDAGRPDHHGRPTVDHAVPHDPGRVVAGILGEDDLAGEALAERRERRHIKRSRQLFRHGRSLSEGTNKSSSERIVRFVNLAERD